MNRAEEERVNGNVRVQQLQTKLLQSEQKIEALEQVIHSFLFDQQFRSFFSKGISWIQKLYNIIT